jgi:recombination protein RecA
MQKQFGDNAVMMASDIPVGDAIATGSVGLDFATGFGGFPSNRVVEIHGKEGTGKTTLALLTMANALRHYPKQLGVFMDVEHKVTKDWMIDIVGEEFANDRIIYCQPTSIENATNVYQAAAESNLVRCAILDSIGGAPTVRRNDDAEIGQVGGNSIGVGHFARVAATYASTHNCLTIGVNQLRAVMGSRIPNLTDTPGGKAWRHACILRIELVRGGETDTIKMPGEDKPVPIGYNIYARVKKNQVGPEGRAAMYWFYNVVTPEHQFGVDYQDEIARLGIKTQVFARSSESSGWYHHPLFPGDKKGDHKVNGLNGIKALVGSDEKLRAALTQEILARADQHAGIVAPLTNPNEELDVDAISPYLLSGGAQ